MHRVLVHFLGGVVEDLPYVGVTGEAFREPFVERVDDIVSGQLSAVKRGLVVPHDALLEFDLQYGRLDVRPTLGDLRLQLQSAAVAHLRAGGVERVEHHLSYLASGVPEACTAPRIPSGRGAANPVGERTAVLPLRRHSLRCHGSGGRRSSGGRHGSGGRRGSGGRGRACRRGFRLIGRARSKQG